MAVEFGTVTTKWIKHCVVTLGVGQFFLVLWDSGTTDFLEMFSLFSINHLICLVATPLKNMLKSVGMMTFPIYGKIKVMFQTTNQCLVLTI